jgi:catechol 2,3-dioxygenase-like lactoylglutathione lyase family enzyme
MSANQSPAAFIKSLFETHLKVSNLERSVEFYGKTLGLELGMKEDARRAAFYWVGGQRNTMLGLWETLPWAPERNNSEPIVPHHFAFEVAPVDLSRVIANVKSRGIILWNFFGKATDVPSVFGWMPAASIYFHDPDGHLLEIIAKLPGEPKPEIGVVEMDDWPVL